MNNTAHNFVRLECGILTDISSPPSPTFKHTLPLKIKDSLLEYHRSKFPLIIDYIHSSKYRVDFYKIQNPHRNWCDVTHDMCKGSRQIQKCARKVSSYNMRKKQFKRYRYKYSYFFITQLKKKNKNSSIPILPHYTTQDKLSLSMCITIYIFIVFVFWIFSLHCKKK